MDNNEFILWLLVSPAITGAAAWAAEQVLKARHTPRR